MAQVFEVKLNKLSTLSTLHNNFAHLVNAFEDIAQSEGKFEEAEKMSAQASALRKEASHYSRMYAFNNEHVAEIEAMDFEAITESLKAEIRALAQNL